MRPVIHFDIVDEKHQLVRVKDQPMQGDAGDFVPMLWKNEQPHQVQSLTQHSVSRIGQLQFWTSLATLRVTRRSRDVGRGDVDYIVFPSPDFLPDPNPHQEIVQQDFIAVAARDPGKLILLAIEWKDGVGYRVTSTVVKEVDWLRVENREWRLSHWGDRENPSHQHFASKCTVILLAFLLYIPSLYVLAQFECVIRRSLVTRPVYEASCRDLVTRLDQTFLG